MFQSEAASVKIKNKNLNVNISAVEGKGRREKKPGLSWIEIWVEGEIWVLKEKKSPSDPSIGSFSAGIQPLSVVQAFIWKEGSPYWRSGPWDGQIFNGIPNLDTIFLDGFTLAPDQDGTFYLTFSFVNQSMSHFLLNKDGNMTGKETQQIRREKKGRGVCGWWKKKKKEKRKSK